MQVSSPARDMVLLKGMKWQIPDPTCEGYNKNDQSIFTKKWQTTLLSYELGTTRPDPYRTSLVYSSPVVSLELMPPFPQTCKIWTRINEWLSYPLLYIPPLFWTTSCCCFCHAMHFTRDTLLFIPQIQTPIWTPSWIISENPPLPLIR